MTTSFDTWEKVLQTSKTTALQVHDVTMAPVQREVTQIFSAVVGDDNDGEFDPDAVVGRTERLAYMIENLVAANPQGYFQLLSVMTVLIILLISGLWTATEDASSAHFGNAVFYTFQIIAAGGYQEVDHDAHIFLHVLMLLTGLIVFAILIGMITDSFQGFVNEMNKGTTKIPLTGHTLILGWNESTVEIICQLALIRRQLRRQNETCIRRLCPWRRISASTPVAEAPIVIMTSDRTKSEMQQAISVAFSAIGISRKRTQIGRHIMCRVGDPTVVNDLQRVGAHRATSILIQMTDADASVSRMHAGRVDNPMTMRTLLALRVVLFTSPIKPRWRNMRVVTQLGAPAHCIDEITFGNTDLGRPILSFQELSKFVNSLLFSCVKQPGLAYALHQLLSFSGPALRLRPVRVLSKKLAGRSFREAALMWEDAAPIGVVDAHLESMVNNEGLVPPGDQIIKETDSLVFLCDKSMPRVCKRDSFPDITEAVEKTTKKHAGATSILVCGWRREWDLPERFAYRLFETCADLPFGTTIMFLNLKKDEGETPFSQFMSRVCQFHNLFSCMDDPSGGSDSQWCFRKGHVVLRHTHGDAGNYSSLEAMLRSQFYEHVIILSSTADPAVEQMSPVCRDSKMLTVMLSLRKIQHQYHLGKPIHVIAENAMETSAMLAMGPKSGGDDGDETNAWSALPDFVNVNDINAAALAQSLAYPRMQPHISQLFSGEPGSPYLRMVNAMKLVPAGTYQYGSIVRHVKAERPHDILVGVRRSSGKIELVPNLLDELSLAPGDNFLIMTRTLTKFQKADLEMRKSESSGSLPTPSGLFGDVSRASLLTSLGSFGDEAPSCEAEPPGALPGALKH